MIFDRVRNVIARQLGLDKEDIEIQTSLESLNVDSLEFMEIIMEIEDEFDISIEYSEVQNMVTVADIVEYIQEHYEKD